ncbi:MAG: hypothetical protein ACFB6R_01050 [Alphaproteobacteria bacterium]
MGKWSPVWTRMAGGLALAALSAGCAFVDRAGLSGPSNVSVDVPSLDELANGTPKMVVRYLGEADVDRVEGGARFWTYGSAACRLYLIFYRQPDGPYTLHHLEMEAIGAITGTSKERLQSCVGAVATQFQAP